MMHPASSRARIAGIAAAAFAGGVLLASAPRWTRASSETMPLVSAPAQQAVRPVAAMNQAFTSIAAAVTPAVVSIEVERPARAHVDGLGPPTDEGMDMDEEGGGATPPAPNAVPEAGSGSGFILSADGYVMTNNHVVAEATRISVVLQDNRALEGRVVGRDPNTDIAVLKVDARGLPTVRLGSSEETRIGEWVLAIGNPLDLGTTVTSGIVSAKGRGLRGLLGTGNATAQWAIEDFIQTDAPINPGNSGGPLVNLRGEVVGVNSAIASPTGYYSGYGFAVPMDLARRVGEDLIRYGRVRRPALGVQVTEVRPEDAEVYKLPRIQGVVVQDFAAASPGRDAGLRPGDVIAAVDGRPVEQVGQFQRLIATRRPGEQVALDVIRYGAARRVRVTLAEAPGQPKIAAAAGAVAPAAAPAAGRLGVAVDVLTPALARELGYRDTRGVVITGVVPYGAGYRAQLRRGLRIVSVDGRPVATPAQFRDAIARKPPRSIVSLGVDFFGSQRGIVNVRLAR